MRGISNEAASVEPVYRPHRFKTLVAATLNQPQTAAQPQGQTMFTNSLMMSIANKALPLLIAAALAGVMLWRNNTLQEEKAELLAELLATKSALAAQKNSFDQYRQQTEAMQQQLAAATQQAATTKTELQDALNDEQNQTWGNTRLPDSIGGLLNR